MGAPGGLQESFPPILVALRLDGAEYGQNLLGDVVFRLPYVCCVTLVETLFFKIRCAEGLLCGVWESYGSSLGVFENSSKVLAYMYGINLYS